MPLCNYVFHGSDQTNCLIYKDHSVVFRCKGPGISLVQSADINQSSLALNCTYSGKKVSTRIPTNHTFKYFITVNISKSNIDFWNIFLFV